jgi:hypothetical protein
MKIEMTTYVGFDVRIFHAVDAPLELQRKLEEFIRTLDVEPDCSVAPTHSVEIAEHSGSQDCSPEWCGFRYGVDQHARCTCDVNPWCPQHGWLVESDQGRPHDWQKEFDLRAVLARIATAREALSPEFRVPADLDSAINAGKALLGSRCEATKLGEYSPLRCARSKGHGGEHAYVVDGEYDVDRSR